jgi:predicted nucleic acid-binding protein
LILLDTGPILALIDRDEPAHARCLAVLESHTGSLITSWAVLTESMYLLQRRGGQSWVSTLWNLIGSGRIEIHHIDARRSVRTRDLMDRYCDLPMSLADATLVTLAEDLAIGRVLTLDRHFSAYRLANGRALEILPA